MAISDPVEAEDLVSLLRSGQAAPEIRRFAARGLLPLDREDQMRALLAVIGDCDLEAAQAALETFRSTPPDQVLGFLQVGDPTATELDVIARHAEDPFVLERVVRLPSVTDQTLEALGRTASGAPQDALIVNQVRLLRNPALIEALFENPALTVDGRRRLNEIREEFFEKGKRRREAERAREEEEARRALEQAAEAEAAPAGVGVAPEGLEPALSGGVVYKRIATLTVSEKINLAYHGDKEERRILIGDSNKLVGLAVLKSRSLTANEVESFCYMRHLDEEIYRTIAGNREWIRKHAVALALVKNPKAALAITLPLVKHLPMRELKGIMHDPNLAEGLRITARKLLEEKRK